jgi:hypothetical protein
VTSRRTHVRGYSYDVTPGGHTACGLRVRDYPEMRVTKGEPTCQICLKARADRSDTFAVFVTVAPGVKVRERVLPLSWKERLITYASVVGAV